MDFMIELNHLNLETNLIAGVSTFAVIDLANYLYLDNNQISHIESLTNNSGINYGDWVYLRDNPLDSMAVKVFIPQLEACGITVDY